jgi:probable addiction module antidote protein
VDRKVAVEYLKAAQDDPRDRGTCLVALSAVAEAYGGLALVASEAGISREALYRALSPKGNPTLKTLIAVLKTVGMRLSVEPEQVAAWDRKILSMNFTKTTNPKSSPSAAGAPGRRWREGSEGVEARRLQLLNRRHY